MRYPVVADFMALFVLCIVVFSAVQAQRAVNALEDTQRESEVARCEAGVENRNVQRKLVESIYELATGNLIRGKNDPPYTEEELPRVNSYIARVNRFREVMYDEIKPPDFCLKHVDDDNVDPPTKPYPRIQD